MSDEKNYGTSGGVPITDEVVEQLAAEAEAGYDLERLMPKPNIVHVGQCLYCGDGAPKTIYWKLTVTGPVLLVDGQPQASAHWWPWMRCEACGHESQGKP